jgi:hypothetical protein
MAGVCPGGDGMYELVVDDEVQDNITERALIRRANKLRKRDGLPKFKVGAE